MDLAPPLSRPRALVLEPDAHEGAALAAALEAAGFAADLAARPNSANALLQVAEQERAPYELLVVSGMVAGICGLDLAAALALRVRARPRTMIASGPYSAPDAEQLRRGRCEGVILKPLRLEQLRGVLAGLFPAERLGAAAGKGIGTIAI